MDVRNETPSVVRTLTGPLRDPEMKVNASPLPTATENPAPPHETELRFTQPLGYERLGLEVSGARPTSCQISARPTLSRATKI